MVPNTNTFSLQDVVNEIIPTTNDLASCIADANASFYDPSYYTAPATSLLEFRNYGAISVFPTVSNTSGGINNVGGFGGFADITIGASDTIAMIFISAYSNLGTVSVTDDKGVTWSLYGTPSSKQAIYYTSDLATTGVRRITYSLSGTFYSAHLAATFINSANKPSGTFITNSSTSSTSVSQSFTPVVATPSLILSIYFSYRGGEVGSVSELDPTSYGTGQVFIDSEGADGSGGPPDFVTTLTKEEKTSTSADTQLFTNLITNDNKFIMSVGLNGI